jgi:hypothetical protein
MRDSVQVIARLEMVARPALASMDVVISAADACSVTAANTIANIRRTTAIRHRSNIHCNVVA